MSKKNSFVSDDNSLSQDLITVCEKHGILLSAFVFIRIPEHYVTSVKTTIVGQLVSTNAEKEALGKVLSSEFAKWINDTNQGSSIESVKH